MKKLLFFGFVFVAFLSSMLLPTQVVCAKVNRVDVVSHITDATDPYAGEILGNPSGMEFWRGITLDVYYTADNDRIQGWCTMVMNRIISPDGTAQGYGTWELQPDEFSNGYWDGTFTASIDSEGKMHVRMRGKGYGSLDGLEYSGYLDGNMLSDVYGVITELPTYSP